MWRRADSRSGASVPRARQAPLNSLILAMRFRISEGDLDGVGSQHEPIAHPFAPIFETHQCAAIHLPLRHSAMPRPPHSGGDSSVNSIGTQLQPMISRCEVERVCGRRGPRNPSGNVSGKESEKR